MSYDEYDMMQDAAMEAMYQSFYEDPDTRQQFYEDLYDDIVKDFTDARLRSFYENQPDLASSAVAALSRSRALQAHDGTAALVFAAIAAEVGIRSTLLTPIVYGLVHTDSAATLVVRLAITKNDENLMKVLLDLLSAHGGLDLRTHRRNGRATTFWEELRSVQKKRNRVVHHAETAAAEETDLALAVATCVLEELFPVVVQRLGFHLHGSTVCDKRHGAKN